MSRTKIAYYDPYGVYQDLSEQFASKLPLVNLHWNAPNRPLRSIPTLDVELLEETVVSESAPKHQMLGLSAAPYLKLIFIQCDDNETYRGSVRTLVREWLTNNVNNTRDPTEWLILHYVPHGGKSGSTNRFKSSVYDKLRADFNSGSKKDRCLQVRGEYTSNMESMEAWSEIMTRIKEAVLDAFSKRVDLYEDEVRKLEAKRNVMGWNFGTFFYMKEGLALSFENISLFDDALILYDELEEAFAGISRQKNVTFFSSVGFDFDSPPNSVLDMQSGSEMRRQIMSNEISLFDFHCYLFGRQAYLLLMISRTSSSASISANKIGMLFIRLRTFLTEITGLLESNKKNLTLIAEWTYNVVQEFTEATKETKEGLDWLVSEGRGEMQLIARKSLETVAASKGWFIQGPLAEVSLNDDNTDENMKDNYKISNKEMVKALESKNSFYDKYRELTKAASAEFEYSNRVRTVNRLSSQLALLDYQLGNYEAACRQLENIPNMYSRQGWDVISTSLLSVYVKCLVKLGRKENILIYSLDLLCKHKYLVQDEISELVKHVQELCGLTDLEIPLENLFTVSISPYIEPSSETCGEYHMNVELKNVLSCEFEFDTAELVLHNIRDSSEQLKLKCENIVCPAKGKDHQLKSTAANLVFKTGKFQNGRYKIQRLTLKKQKLVFFKQFEEPPIVDIFQTPNSLWSQLRTPRLFRLPERRFVLDINTPEPIENCQVLFKALTPGTRLNTGQSSATADGEVIESKEVRPHTVGIGKFGKQASIEIAFVASYDTKSIQIRSSVNYTTAKGKFQHVCVEDLDVMLAIDVNVHDYFKSSKLLSKFSVSCKNQQEPVRILQAELKSSEHYKASSPFGSDDAVVAFPGGPVSYVYAIKREPGLVKEEELELRIEHRYIRDGKL